MRAAFLSLAGAAPALADPALPTSPSGEPIRLSAAAIRYLAKIAFTPVRVFHFGETSLLDGRACRAILAMHAGRA